MDTNFRHIDILKIAKRDGKVTVDQLAEHFDVTLQTIRRDLTELAEEKKLIRVHGGAVLPSGTVNIEYEARRDLNAEAKARIAKACAQSIPHGSSVFLNIGTSTEAVARALLTHTNLMVVTNNMNVAHIFAENTQIQTVVTGGTLRPTDRGLVGTLATEAIRKFKFDVAVVGCSALDYTGDLLDFDVEEVAASQTIIAQARQCFLVADASKLMRSAPVRIASLRDLSGIFTDAALPDDLTNLCRDWGTQVSIASGN